MAQRDRATGWKHAKLSGHRNEDLVKQLLDENKEYARDFLVRIGLGGDKIVGTSVGGLHETNVASVLGRKTKSKTDLKIFLESGKTVNISIKKSLGGQVYFVRAGLFIETFEEQFGKVIPADVKRAIELFWAEADDALDIIEEYSDKMNSKNYDLQIRHKSLNSSTLKSYDEKLYNSLLKWFKNNIYEIAELCFSMGSARDEKEWSEYIWYINLLGENEVDMVFHIDEICSSARDSAEEETWYSTTNGGTTIQLPFGFVQWHQAQMQFHHNYEKLKNMIE